LLRLIVTIGTPLVALAFVALNGRRSFLSLLVLWVAFSLAGAVAGGFPYAHYLVQAFPPLAVLVMAAGRFAGAWRRLAPLIALGVLVVLAVWRYTDSFTTKDFIRTGRYYQGFAASLVSRDPERFHDTFLTGWWRTRDVVQALDRVGAADQPVLVYGNHAWIYPLANVWPVGRFVMESHVRGDPARERELMLAIASETPAFIVVEEDVTLFPALDALVVRAYRCQDRVPGFLICRLDLHTKLPAIITRTLVYQRSDRVMKRLRITLYRHEHRRNTCGPAIPCLHQVAITSGRHKGTQHAPYRRKRHKDHRPGTLRVPGGACACPRNRSRLRGRRS
jgi:hypothetical protein